MKPGIPSSKPRLSTQGSRNFDPVPGRKAVEKLLLVRFVVAEVAFEEGAEQAERLLPVAIMEDLHGFKSASCAYNWQPFRH